MSATQDGTAAAPSELRSWAHSFASEPEKAYETLSKRMQASQTSLKQVLSHFGERTQIDEDYTKKLLKTLEHNLLQDEPALSLRESEDFYQKQLEVMVRTHQQMNQKIRDLLIEPLQEYASNKKLTQKHFDHEYERHSKAVKSSFATMEKKAKDYASRCRDEVKAAEKVAQSAGNSKLTAKDCEKLAEAHKKARAQMEESEAEYKGSITRHNQFQLAFDNKWAELNETLRAKEDEGLRLTRESLRNVALAQLDLYQLHAKTISRIIENMDSINPEQDLNQFVAVNRTGNLLPPRYTFVSFYDLPTNSGRVPAPSELRNAFQITLEEEEAHGQAPFDPSSLAGQGASRSSLALNLAHCPTGQDEGTSPRSPTSPSSTSPATSPGQQQENDDSGAPLARTGSQRSVSGNNRGVQVLPQPPSQIQLRKTGSLTRINGVAGGALVQQQRTSPLANQVASADGESDDEGDATHGDPQPFSDASPVNEQETIPAQ